MKRQLFMFVAGGVVCSTSFTGFAAEKIDFAQDVKPILESACLSCHDARQSSGAAPSMVPRLSKCLGCHDTSTQPPRVPLQCMSCHSYHPDGAPGVAR